MRGKGNQITTAASGGTVITTSGGTVTATSGKESREPRFWTSRRAGAIIVGLATIATMLALHPF